MMTMELRQEVWHTWVVAQRVWNVTWARPVCVTVQVQANDIRHALQDARLERESSRYCPVARAFCRTLGVPLGHVSVGPYNVDCEAWQDHGSLEGFLPPEVTRALDQFDRTRTMVPLTFHVPLQPWRRAGDTSVTGAPWGKMQPSGVAPAPPTRGEPGPHNAGLDGSMGLYFRDERRAMPSRSRRWPGVTGLHTRGT